MIQGVIFDMDGVLFDTERVNEVILKQAAKEQGATLSDDTFKKLLGVNTITSKHIMSTSHPNIDYDRMVERWDALMFEYINQNGMPLKKGMPDILIALKKRNIKIGLATSTDRNCVDFYFDKADVHGYFDAITCGKEVPTGKPSPDIYLVTAQKLGISPKYLLGVEDSLNGVKAVRSAGMRCVMIPDILPFSSAHAPYVDVVYDELMDLCKELQV